jgi:hypothetical protein
MIGRRLVLRTLAIAAIGAMAVVPAGATSIRRASLDRLVSENAIVVVGHVVDVYSHWNADGTFILSDVRVVVDDALKGDAGQREFVFTAMGGTVGDLSTIIVGGPDIEVGRKYVLFLNREDVPGLSNALMVRDLSQGIFDVVDSPKGKWAVNQSIRHGLVPDASGSVVPPGGMKGTSLAAISRDIRRLAVQR